MIRGLALTASFLLAGAVPALAQTHPPSHSRTHPPGHVAPDSAHRAAIHALLHGSWKGTLSHHGVYNGLDLSVAHDSLRKVSLTMSTDHPIRAGAASEFVIRGDSLHWTQDVSGKSCKATAVLSAATPLVPERMKGKMTCEDGEITFSVQKKTG